MQIARWLPPRFSGATCLRWLGVMAAVLAPAMAEDKIALTPAEEAWLAGHREWRVVGSNSPPFQWIDEQGIYRGLGADYDALISKKLGTSVRAVPAPTWEESLRQLQNGGCDACTMIIHTPERERILNFTKEILKLPTVALVRTDSTKKIRQPSDLGGKLVAVPRSWAIHEQLRGDGPEIRLEPRDSVEEALMAVSTGHVDAYVGDLASATHAMEKLGLTNLKVACMMPYTYSLRIGVRKDWPELVPILNRAIDAMSQEEREGIVDRWMPVRVEGWALRDILAIGGPVVVVFGVVSLLLYVRQLRREIRLRRAAESEVIETQNATIVALAALAEIRDQDTGAHLHRTQLYVKMLAEELRRHGHAELDDLRIEMLYKTAPLHDIGKVGIPDHILNKPGRLEPEEFEIMKTHTTLGAMALEKAGQTCHRGGLFLQLAREIAISHHEKWDGSGYPHGLAGKAIPMSGRLMSVADVYDALRSERVYKSAMSHAEAVDIIRKGRGNAFDPGVVDGFLALEKEFEKISEGAADESCV